MAASPVCGDDGITYRSRCHLQQAICNGEHVKFQYRGECAERQNVCEEQRKQALKTSNETGIPIFVPVCHEDGSYVSVQCYYGTGYCWCVSDGGKPVPGTSIQYARPNCVNKGRRRRNRRGKQKRKKKNKRTRKKACTQADRSEFNTHVTELIIGEYRSLHGRVPDGALGSHKKEMIEWKFDQMDTNRDGHLRKREFKTFRRSVKRLARKKMCARNFWQYCDMKSDGVMTKSEWTGCLGVDTNIPLQLFTSLSSQEDHARKRKDKARNKWEGFTPTDNGDDDDDGTDDDAGEWSKNIFTPLDSPVSGQTTEQDCRTAYRSVVESTRNGIPNAFIPDCDANGNYRSIQCHKSSGWCWCVHKKTGAHLPGTSQRNQRPDCSKVPTRHVPLPKPWKKCPEDEKKQFLVHLMDYMTDVMTHTNDSAASFLFTGDNADLTIEERVAKWHFYKLDTNRNGAISRKELRPLRLKLTDHRRLKRCGKRIQLHCDQNNDQTLTETEWITCVHAKKDQIRGKVPNMNNSNGRRGPNPLETWLKAD